MGSLWLNLLLIMYVCLYFKVLKNLLCFVNLVFLKKKFFFIHEGYGIGLKVFFLLFQLYIAYFNIQSKVEGVLTYSFAYRLFQ